MKYVSMHPVKYLRAHLVYESIRINLSPLLNSHIIILMILCASALGGLYSTLAPVKHIEPDATEHAYMNLFPHEMPNVVKNHCPDYHMWYHRSE
jgi:hypothetical protein